ncbi:acyl carrier protein [Plantactinospora sp. GCM10030261]|uniref:acyl carrier protein n=1 Tax=Plantactinospora sp. GCM10030261 TaxID=3273420 RepID=UPI003610068C
MTTTDLDRKQLTERTIGVLADVVRREPESLRQDTRLFADLGMDSTNALELLMTLEDEFGFEFDAETLEARHLETVGSLTDYIAEQAGG